MILNSFIKNLILFSILFFLFLYSSSYADFHGNLETTVARYQSCKGIMKLMEEKNERLSAYKDDIHVIFRYHPRQSSADSMRNMLVFLLKPDVHFAENHLKLSLSKEPGKKLQIKSLLNFYIYWHNSIDLRIETFCQLSDSLHSPEELKLYEIRLNMLKKKLRNLNESRESEDEITDNTLREVKTIAELANFETLQSNEAVIDWLNELNINIQQKKIRDVIEISYSEIIKLKKENNESFASYYSAFKPALDNVWIKTASEADKDNIKKLIQFLFAELDIDKSSKPLISPQKTIAPETAEAFKLTMNEFRNIWNSSLKLRIDSFCQYSALDSNDVSDQVINNRFNYLLKLLTKASTLNQYSDYTDEEIVRELEVLSTLPSFTDFDKLATFESFKKNNEVYNEIIDSSAAVKTLQLENIESFSSYYNVLKPALDSLLVKTSSEPDKDNIKMLIHFLYSDSINDKVLKSILSLKNNIPIKTAEAFESMLKKFRKVWHSSVTLRIDSFCQYSAFDNIDESDRIINKRFLYLVELLERITDNKTDIDYKDIEVIQELEALSKLPSFTSYNKIETVEKFKKSKTTYDKIIKSSSAVKALHLANSESFSLYYNALKPALDSFSVKPSVEADKDNINMLIQFLISDPDLDNKIKPFLSTQKRISQESVSAFESMLDKFRAIWTSSAALRIDSFCQYSTLNSTDEAASVINTRFEYLFKMLKSSSIDKQENYYSDTEIIRELDALSKLPSFTGFNMLKTVEIFRKNKTTYFKIMDSSSEIEALHLRKIESFSSYYDALKPALDSLWAKTSSDTDKANINMLIQYLYFDPYGDKAIEPLLSPQKNISPETAKTFRQMMVKLRKIWNSSVNLRIDAFSQYSALNKTERADLIIKTRFIYLIEHIEGMWKQRVIDYTDTEIIQELEALSKLSTFTNSKSHNSLIERFQRYITAYNIIMKSSSEIEALHTGNINSFSSFYNAMQPSMDIIWFNNPSEADKDNINMLIQFLCIDAYADREKVVKPILSKQKNIALEIANNFDKMLKKFRSIWNSSVDLRIDSFKRHSELIDNEKSNQILITRFKYIIEQLEKPKNIKQALDYTKIEMIQELEALSKLIPFSNSKSLDDLIERFQIQRKLFNSESKGTSDE